MCKFESSQKDESRWQSTDSLKAYRNISAFKCNNKYILPDSFWMRIVWFQPKRDLDLIQISFFKNRIG